ncbi:MAG: hypothetical protein QXR48_03100 [Candidatus Woesearchaeota archaeon]
MSQNDSFYLLEETIELIRGIERNLELHKLDPRKGLDWSDANTRRQVAELIKNLNVLLSAKERDPRLLRLVVEVQGLREFLLLLSKALEGRPEYLALFRKKEGVKTRREINKAIDRIVAKLEEWSRIAEEKVHAHRQGVAKNKYLENLPSPASPDYFYVMVKELNPLQTKYLHPFDPRQLDFQKRRSTDDLLNPDPTDPISGYRVFEPGDKTVYPGSGIRIVGGHHRTFELYRRYLKGELSGDTLVLVRKRYAA